MFLLQGDEQNRATNTGWPQHLRCARNSAVSRSYTIQGFAALQVRYCSPDWLVGIASIFCAT